MTQAVRQPGALDPGSLKSAALEPGGWDAVQTRDGGRHAKYRRMSRSRRRSGPALRGDRATPYEADVHLLDGPGWWHPWLAGLLWLAVPAMLKLIPGRPWWEFFPAFAVLGIGLGVTYAGWRAGNPVQRACCVLLGLALLAMAAKLGDWVIGAHIHSGPLNKMDSSYEL